MLLQCYTWLWLLYWVNEVWCKLVRQGSSTEKRGSAIFWHQLTAVTVARQQTSSIAVVFSVFCIFGTFVFACILLWWFYVYFFPTQKKLCFSDWSLLTPPNSSSSSVTRDPSCRRLSPSCIFLICAAIWHDKSSLLALVGLHFSVATSSGWV